jgi:cytosine/adenosine deaminase-related metal-dependent hydrolase
MEFFSAQKVFSPSGKMVLNGVLVMQGQRVVDFIDPAQHQGPSPDSSSVRKLNGILSPGFINAHCHLELSGLAGMLSKGSGLAGFILELQRIRSREDEDMIEAARRQDQYMFDCGIQAVGDICNSALTIPVKAASRLYYHSFVELFSFRPELAASTFEKGKVLLDRFSGMTNANGIPLSSSLSPHAPYSTSMELMELISLDSQGLPTSIHMMESMAEYEFLMEATGDFKRMMDEFRIRVNDLVPYSRNPFNLFLSQFASTAPVIAVHNTYLDLLQAELTGNKLSREVFYCLCPRANQYIEKVNPPLDLFRSLNLKIVLGTDSLASNDDLNIMNEVRQILSFLSVPTEEWMSWLTLNGAKSLGIQDQFGSFEKGKTPGVLLISDDLTVERII